jgi:hypothetical protein
MPKMLAETPGQNNLRELAKLTPRNGFQQRHGLQKIIRVPGFHP